MATELIHLSLVTGSALRDAGGDRLGRVDDLIVRLGDPGYPPITGLLVRVARRLTYVPADLVDRIEAGDVRLAVPRLDLRHFERRPEEVLLKKDVLDHQLINIDGARLVRANEIELARVDGWYRVVGVDTGPRGALRRLVPRAASSRIGSGDVLDWASVEPFVGHVPSVRLSIPHPRLAKLHPAQIADLVEAASHAEGAEIFAAVHDDAELEADVFEELDEHHALEFFEERDDAEVADVLARMAPDDAADVIAELDEDRRDKILDALPPPARVKVRALLGFDRATAGGLMSTDFLCLYSHATVAEVTDRLRRTPLDPQTTTTIFAMDTRRRLEGAVALLELVVADSATTLAELARPVPALDPEADFDEIARTMADYNLTMAAVTDAELRMIGVITVDDALEVILPKGWRRRFGLLGDD